MAKIIIWRDSFCDHVTSFDLSLGEGTVLHCSRTEHPDLFAATCGGMGLTGILLSTTFKLIPIATSRIEQKTERAPNLESAMALFEASLGCTYSVAWIDCLATGPDLGSINPDAWRACHRGAARRARSCDTSQVPAPQNEAAVIRFSAVRSEQLFSSAFQQSLLSPA